MVSRWLDILPWIVRGEADCIDDLLVAGATAHVSRKGLPNLGVRRVGRFSQQAQYGQQESRRAESALQRMAAPERILEAMRLSTRRKPLDSGDLMAACLHCQEQAREHRFAVQQDGAGSTASLLASDVGAGQVQVLTEVVGQ
jgi:hypothetical protein